ncbi:MAG: oligosaccharide flippase family protein [Desulfobacterales bacterium]|nr:oligosaccharide flippase family protein [Desulfobacterales bacterium]
MPNEKKTIFGLTIDKTILLVAAGTYAGAAAAFLSNLIVGRVLGPSGLGVFAVFLAVSPVVYELSGHGLDSAVVKFAAPEFKRRETGRAARVYRLILNLKIGVNLILILLGFTVLSSLLSRVVGSSEHLSAIRYALFYALFFGFGISLWRYALSVFQSRRAYSGYLATLLGNSILRLGLLIGAALFFSAGIRCMMAIYIVSAFAAFLLGMLLLPDARSFFKFSMKRDDLLREIGEFSGWIILSTLLFILVEPLNVFMIEFFADNHAVGLFTAALILAKCMDHLVMSIKTVLLPRVSLLQGRSHGSYLKKCLAITTPLALLVLPLFFLSDWIVPFLFTDRFSGAVPIFNVLFWGYWISLLLDPMWLVFYAAGKTRCLVYADAFMLTAIFGLNLIMTPRLGALGAAYSLVAARFLGRCLLGFLLWRHLQQTRREP